MRFSLRPPGGSKGDMSARTKATQSEFRSPPLWAWPTDEGSSPGLTPKVSEELAKLRTESQLIPFILSTTLRAEQSPNGSPPLSPVGAGNIVEILDKVRFPP